jgi:hypothetical protein
LTKKRRCFTIYHFSYFLYHHFHKFHSSYYYFYKSTKKIWKFQIWTLACNSMSLTLKLWLRKLQGFIIYELKLRSRFHISYGKNVLDWIFMESKLFLYYDTSVVNRLIYKKNEHIHLENIIECESYVVVVSSIWIRSIYAI